MPKIVALVALSIFVAMGAWVCGGNDADVTVVAQDTKFNPASITVQSGEEVTLKLQNNDAIEHDLQVDGLNVDVIAGGSDRPEHGGGEHGAARTLAMHTAGRESMTITFMANKPGTYEFYCTIPGHKDSGMSGTLIVE